MSSNFNYQGVANTIAHNRTNASYAAGFGTLLNTALQSYRQHILDQQANNTLATMNAPKATAVTDADGNPIFDDTDATDANGVTDPTKEADWNAGVIDADHTDGYGYTPGTAPNAGGVAGLQMRMALNNAQSTQAYKQARIAKLLAPPAARATNPMDDALKQARLDRIKAGMPGADGLTANQRRIQAYQNSTMTQRQAKSAAAVDPANEFNAFLKTNAGITLPQWQNLQGSHMVKDVDPATGLGTGDPNGDTLEATLNGKTVHIPKPVYNSALNLYQSVLQARNQPAAVSGGSLPQGSSAPTGALFGGSAPATSSSADDQAIAWASANPDDPRAAAILKRLGMQ